MPSLTCTDGPVDAIWIENMNTVLDDNKKLCLMSGEMIAMSAAMSMIFEVQDLAVASPATVSRCGMVYTEPSQIGWEPLLTSWLETLPPPLAPHADKLNNLFGWLVPPCVRFVDQGVQGDRLGRHPSDRRDHARARRHVALRLKLTMDVARRPAAEQSDADAEAAGVLRIGQEGSAAVGREHLPVLARLVGRRRRSTARARPKFDEFLRAAAAGQAAARLRQGRRRLRRGGAVGEVHARGRVGVRLRLRVRLPARVAQVEAVDRNDRQGGHQDPADLPSSRRSWCRRWTRRATRSCSTRSSQPRQPVLFVGPTGTGKTVYVQKKLLGLPADPMDSCIFINYSAQTSANQSQDIIDGKLDKRRKGVFGPPMGKRAVIFVDDLNMPQLEVYGAQPPIELLRQWMDHSGWYDRKENTFRRLVDLSFVCAMGPPGGGRNPITPRYMRHFNIVAFTPFDEPSMQRSSRRSWTGGSQGGLRVRVPAPLRADHRRDDGRVHLQAQSMLRQPAADAVQVALHLQPARLRARRAGHVPVLEGRLRAAEGPDAAVDPRGASASSTTV